MWTVDGEHFTGMGVGRIDFELQKLSFIQRLVDPGFHTKSDSTLNILVSTQHLNYTISPLILL